MRYTEPCHVPLMWDFRVKMMQQELGADIVIVCKANASLLVEIYEVHFVGMEMSYLSSSEMIASAIFSNGALNFLCWWCNFSLSVLVWSWKVEIFLISNVAGRKKTSYLLKEFRSRLYVLSNRCEYEMQTST